LPEKGAPGPKIERTERSPSLSPKEKQIWDLLSNESLHVDQLVRQAGIGISPMLSLLLEMELRGLIKQLPGKFFIRN
jgi:DNA processing protein